MRPARVVAIVAVLLVGCASYSGGGRALDPGRFNAEPGWIVAATPALRQHGALDCGPAALAMIAARWHLRVSVEGAAAWLPAPSPLGASLGDLRDAARAHGLTAFAIAGDRETLIHELQAGRPVVIGLLLPYGRDRALSHFEVIVAARPDQGQFATLDPATGWRVRSWLDLDAEWRPAGRPTLVVLGRSIGDVPLPAAAGR